MTKIEQIEFENEEKFMEAIKKLLKSEEGFRTIKGKNNEPVKIKIISKGRLFFNNGFSFKVSVAENKKIYCSLEYFGVEDRIKLAKMSTNLISKEI